MHRFFVSESAVQGDTVTVTGSDVNHIRNVLRMKKGDRAEIVSDAVKLYECEIVSESADEVVLRILEEKRETQELPVRITLYQGLPKGDKLEFVIQKAVELGASEIVPVEMERSVARIEEKREEKKNARYREIAKSAAKQSGRLVIPEVGRAVSFREALRKAQSESDLLIVPYECESDDDASFTVLQSVKRSHDPALFIGPEGGFSLREIEELRKAGAHTVTLGRRILRTETAGLAALAMLVYLLEIES